jgi:HK97 family phage major capsid protein
MAGSVQRTRAFRVEKVKASPGATAEAPKTYTFRANDGEFDRYQDRLSVQGWDLRAFNANPVILYNHDAGDGGFLGLGRKDVLPIGKGRAYVEANALLVDVQFDQADDFAKKVEQKVDGGFLNAVSVRYTIPDGAYEENSKGGLDSTSQELLEISIVTIPGNQRALRVKGFDEQSNHTGDTMNQEQIEAAMKKVAGDAAKAAAAEAFAAMKSEAAKIEAEKVAKVEAEKAEEARVQAKVDAALNDILANQRGQRSAPLRATDGVQVGDRAAVREKGLDFARFIRAKAAAQLDNKTIDAVLKEWDAKLPGNGYAEFAKALSSGSYSGMGSLVRPQWATDFIELLRVKTSVRKAGARSVTGAARLEFDGQATSGTAYWGTETGNITASNPTTNKPLTLTEKKLTALSVIPNDLIRNASISADQFVLSDLTQVVAIEEDLQFFYGPGTVNRPLGLAFQLAAANIYAMTALGSAGVPTVAEMKKEIDKALKTMKLANAPMNDIKIFTSPSPEAAVLDAVASSGDGSNMLELEYSQRGTLRNKPVFITNQMKEDGSQSTINGNANKQTDLLFFDMSEVIILDSMDLEAEVFPNGTYYNGTVAVSGISTDQTVCRLIKKVDIGIRHNVSGVRVKALTWGMP